MSVRRRAAATAMTSAALFSLAACVGDPANPPLFGYRQNAAGDVVIAYPICPDREVAGAAIMVRAPERGNNYAFSTIWSAHDPVSPQVRRGVFTVGGKAGFSVEDRPPARKRPDGFYVKVEEAPADRNGDGRTGWIALSELKDAGALKAGEYMTSAGKAMTRAQINGQLTCRARK